MLFVQKDSIMLHWFFSNYNNARNTKYIILLHTWRKYVARSIRFQMPPRTVNISN